jgi:hypothetical protein
MNSWANKACEQVQRAGFAVLLVVLCMSSVYAGVSGASAHKSAFRIRGTLPWHNFLSGPTAWNEEDYERYLERLKALGLNFVGFHCYTGGAERYAPYVEPMIRIEYRDVVPLAGFDTSSTARWGYRPLLVRDFAFGTSELFELPPGAKAFGARCAILATDNEDRYRRAQLLIRRVLEMAHERQIQMAIGFEFGIHPPEFSSIVPPDSWIRGAMLPDPTHPASIEILRATIDDVLKAYPGIDWIWLWLHEHTMHVGQARLSGSFQDLYDKEASLFGRDGGDGAKFTGVWSLAYVREAYSYLRRRSPKVKVAIGGWGGGAQLPAILQGLDKVLPKDIVFTCLNSNQGWSSQPEFLAEIAKDRPVWAIPWLEGDAKLWHPQPRVKLMREHVKLAAAQKLDGVVAIHWRTEETRLNLDAFARFAIDPADEATVEDMYVEDCRRLFGTSAGAELAPILARMDAEGWFNVPNSPEYFPYDPQWGRIDGQLRARLEKLVALVERLGSKDESAAWRPNLDRLAAECRFTLLLDEVGRKIEPAYRLKQRWLSQQIAGPELSDQKQKAVAALEQAPIEQLFKEYSQRVRSRGELGVLSSLNQKLWLQYSELAGFLRASDR